MTWLDQIGDLATRGDLSWEDRRAIVAAHDALSGSFNVSLVVAALRDREREEQLATREWLADVVYKMETFADRQHISGTEIEIAVARWRAERKGRSERAST